MLAMHDHLMALPSYYGRLQFDVYIKARLNETSAY